MLGLGWGHTHAFDRSLTWSEEGLSYVRPVGCTLLFPQLAHDGDREARQGIVLTRLSRRLYRVETFGEPALEFAFLRSGMPARPVRLTDGVNEVAFDHDAADHLPRSS